MSNLAPSFKQPERVPFWRDGRILGVLAQILFLALLFWGISWVFNNISTNIGMLGEAQFICRDGKSNPRCAFDFLSTDAQFEIQESLISYTPEDSYWRGIAVAILNTAKVSVVGIILATLLGTFAGIARLSTNWLVSNLAKWYIDLMRNTPLLLQLFFLYFVVLLALPRVEEAFQLFNLPIYLSQRGVNYPSFVLMTSFPTWLAFLVLGIIQAELVWIILGRWEEQSGHSHNRLGWAVVSFVVVAAIGWVVASNNSQNEAMLVAKADRVREFKDLAALMQRRLEVNDVADIETAVLNGQLTPETVEANALVVCSLQDSPSEVNFAVQLRRAHIPYRLQRFDRPDQAIEGYIAGECDLFIASYATLAAERDLLGEESNNQLIVPVAETPMRLSVPALEGFNFVGGGKMSTEFTALLVGLVLFTAAFIAEIVRAGILAVPRGQSEAARALGLSEGQRLRLVVMPQALRVIIPPLTSQYLNLTKNSSLGLAVAFPDLYRTIQTMVNQSGRPVQLILLMAGTYLVISLVISAFLNWYNAQIALVER